MTPLTLKMCILGALGLSYGVNLVLGLLNTRHKKTEVDQRFADFIDAEAYRKLLSYNTAKARFALTEQTVTFIILFLFILWNGAGWVDSFLFPWLGDQKLRGLAFFGILGLASSFLGLPFELYFDFSLEARFGFNTKTARTFWTDKIKGLILSAVLGGALLYLLLLFVEILGPWFWISFAVVLFAFMVLFSTLYTTLIVPLFNKLTPLEEGELKASISALARETQFPLSGVYLMNASKRSKKSNAFFSGFGKFKKVILFDTLLAAHPAEEITAILAHEIGHYKRGHILKLTLLSGLSILITVGLFSLFIATPAFSLALGVAQPAPFLNLLAFGLLYEPLSMILGLGTNALSRRFEYQADAYAVTHGDPRVYGTALKRLFAVNMADLYPHRLYVLFNYTHPPVLERLEAIDRIAGFAASGPADSGYGASGSGSLGPVSGPGAPGPLPGRGDR